MEEEMGGSYEEAGRERVGAFVRDREGASACEERKRESERERKGRRRRRREGEGEGGW